MARMLVAALLAARAAAADVDLPGTEEAFVATAFDRRTGAVVYRELHRHTFRGPVHTASHVVYVGPSGDTLAVKNMAFVAGPAMPDFRLEDRRTGYVEGAVADADSLLLFRRRPGEADTESRAMAWAGPTVVDGGFDHAVRSAWNRLLRGEAVRYDFAVPSRLGRYGFRLRHVGATEHNGRAAVRLRIEPSSFFLRRLVPAIDLVYDRHSRRLLVYEGISNLVDPARGQRYDTRIEFVYPDPLLQVALRTGEEGDALASPDPEEAL